MIRIWAILLLLAATGTGAAQTVKVTSGEHDGFTRLVLDFGDAVDWQVGRTIDGYEVRASEAARPYDLTAVFRVIGRSRLASVWADPATGALRIGIGCACHAQPFEFRPGIVVIDLKDGPPPPQSSFETTLDGTSLPGLVSRPALRPRARPAGTGRYKWTDLALAAPDRTAVPARTEPTIGIDPALAPLHRALLEQLSVGAARGVVDMALPGAATGRSSPPAEGVRIGFGDLPGVRLNGSDDAPRGLTAAGGACAADPQLDIATWGDTRPVSTQFAGAKTGLTGEFDLPDPVALQRAARFFLFVGFGAEVRQLLAMMPTQQPDAALWTSLAHILDDTVDVAPAFGGMASCDTAAALWAVLSTPAPRPGEEVDRAAALRSFSALPVHLRRHLGPRLAGRFIARDDAAAARMVRDAVLRVPGDAGPDVTVMEARLDLAAGEHEGAAARLEPLIEQPGPATPAALIALVASRVATRTPLEPDQILALGGLLHERRNTALEPEFALALTLAQAVSGDFEAAFASLSATPEAEPEVWTLLAELGPDSDLLSHAVLPDGPAVDAPATVAAALAARLTDLGLGDAAKAWLDRVPDPDRGLAAKIALRQRDARGALRLLAGSLDESLLPLKAEALSLLGDDAALAAVLDQTGDDAGQWRAIGRARDWTRLAEQGPEPWKAVATLTTAAPDPEPEPALDAAGPAGALATGAALLESSAATRSAIRVLLTAVQPPSR